MMNFANITSADKTSTINLLDFKKFPSVRELHENNIKKVKELFPANEKDIKYVKISPEGLEQNIADYYKNGKLRPTKNAEQQKILDEFIKYKILADQFIAEISAMQSTVDRFDNLFSQVASLKPILQSHTLKTRESNYIEKVEQFLAYKEEFSDAISKILKAQNFIDPYKDVRV